MAAPTYSSDLTDILTDMASTTGWTAIGTPAALTAPETDDFIQGNNCISKGAWSSAVRGMIYSAGTVTITSGKACYMWLKYDAPGSLDVEAGTPGGMQVIIGDAAGAYKCWDVRGSDTILYGGWVCAVIDPAFTADDTVGSPSSTTSYFGGRANVPSGGPSKGSPWKIDAFRWGRDYTITDGDLSNGYGTFSGLATHNDASTRRYGMFQAIDGGYLMQCRMLLGSAATAVDFRDSNKQVLIGRLPKVPTNFQGFEIRNTGSRVDWTNINFIALGTNTKGYFNAIDNATINLTDCGFTDMNTFTFKAASTVSNCVFRRCGQITSGGANLSGSTVTGYTGAADSSAVLWNETTDPNTKLANMTFVMGTNDHHAIQFGDAIPSEITLTGCDFSGFSASDSVNASTLYFADTTGTITLNLVSCTGNISIKTAGCTVTKVINPVTATITVKDITNNAVIQGARVLVVPVDASGDMNYQESCSITFSGGTCTVSHTAHGLATNDYVWIQGCNEWQYNGIHQITVTGANGYTYTISGSPSSPATGSPTSTEVLITGTTNASGQITKTRSFTVNQTIEGKVREGTDPTPNYKTSPISGTVDKDSGVSITVFMIRD